MTDAWPVCCYLQIAIINQEWSADCYKQPFQPAAGALKYS